MQRTLKIGLASGLGGLIGSLIALSLSQYLWWLGLVAGGFAGYISYEFKQVLFAIKRAWETVTEKSWEDVKNIASVVIVMIGPMPILVLLTLNNLISGDLAVLLAMFSSVLLMLKVLLIVPKLGHKKDNEIRRIILLRLNFLATMFWAFSEAIKALRLTFGILKKMSLKVVPFTRAVMVQIHSECRMICLVYGSLGTLSGYVFGSALIGAVVGFCGGIATYEIVSKRILGLAKCRE